MPVSTPMNQRRRKKRGNNSPGLSGFEFLGCSFLFIFIFDSTIIILLTLSPELRKSIIIQVRKGKQYREIAKELNISVGSIANTVKKHHKTRSSERRVSSDNISDVGENTTLSTDFNITPSSACIGDG